MLKRIIIVSFDERDIVLDSFSGSGTTAVVAKRLNRNCISIDKENKYKRPPKRV
jgi:DNA modification methylase